MDENERTKLAKEVASELCKAIYTEIGRGVVKKLFWGMVSVGCALAIVLGVIKLPG